NTARAASTRKTSEGKPAIEMEMFHNTVPHLAAVTLSFEVLSGITIEQTRDLIEKMNDQIVEVAVTPKRESSNSSRGFDWRLRVKTIPNTSSRSCQPGIRNAA